MRETKIQWTDHTFNPWWGCTRVSPGCEHCYAESFAKRVGQKVWGVKADRRFFGEEHWDEPRRWNLRAGKEGRRRRVFCASMADVFEDRRDLDDVRAMLWEVVEATPNLDWQLLTKRPQNIARMVPPSWLESPRLNVWYGTTAEDQQRADERIPLLLRTPAAVRFVSAEPLLGPVDLCRFLPGWGSAALLAWVIVGGESGPGARSCDVAWIRSIVEQCRAANVPVFVKQLGANIRDRNDAFGGWYPEMWPEDLDPDAVEHDINGFREEYQGAPVRVHLRDRKGGSPEEWPADLRVREFPC